MTNEGYYSDANHGAHEYFDLGPTALASGYTLPEARLAYQTMGTLNEAKDNAVLFPHMFSGTSASMQIWAGAGRPLDPAKYFLIFPGQFGGGFSSSPSNTAAPYGAGGFPPLSILDDVAAQHPLVTEHFGISTLHAVMGWSMGAQQTYGWLTAHPEMVPRAAIFAGNARTPVHNQVFDDTAAEALSSDPAFADGYYADSVDVHVGLARHAMVFSLMGLSAQWYRDELWRGLGFASADDFRTGFVRAYFALMDPNNLLAQIAKWRAADASDQLGAITGKVFVCAFSEDLLFPPADHAADAAKIPGAELRVIETAAGHFAMFALLPADVPAIDAVIAETLSA